MTDLPTSIHINTRSCPGPMPAKLGEALGRMARDVLEIQEALESSDPRKLFKVPLTTVLRPGEQPLGSC